LQNNLKENPKKNRRIQIKLDNNKYYHYQINSTLDDYYEIYNKNDELLNLNNEKEIMDLDNYKKILKNKNNIKPIIKKYDKSTIKINKDYKNTEFLSEKDIIPDLYEEEVEDIRSLEKLLERSIDKSFDKSYDKWYGQSLNDKREDYK
jgi:protein subunit release factor A